MPEAKALIRCSERPAELEFHHPLNPSSELRGFQLSRLCGLRRSALNWFRLPPGRESFVAHSHATEEEWIYVLSGRGLARIGSDEVEVGPGDFMGFATPSVVHHLRNPFGEDLVYLCGGEMRELEVAEYPDQGMVLVRKKDAAFVVPREALRKIL
jgi:uncharacterized cupin superfamily protein